MERNNGDKIILLQRGEVILVKDHIISATLNDKVINILVDSKVTTTIDITYDSKDDARKNFEYLYNALKYDAR